MRLRARQWLHHTQERTLHGGNTNMRASARSCRACETARVCALWCDKRRESGPGYVLCVLLHNTHGMCGVICIWRDMHRHLCERAIGVGVCGQTLALCGTGKDAASPARVPVSTPICELVLLERKVGNHMCEQVNMEKKKPCDPRVSNCHLSRKACELLLATLPRKEPFRRSRSKSLLLCEQRAL